MSYKILAFTFLLAACSTSHKGVGIPDGGSPGGNDGSTTQNNDGSASMTDGGNNGSGDMSIQPATSGISITVEPDGTNVAQNLLTAIQNAQSAVHVEIYLLTNSSYLTALKNLHAAGKEVKVILNQNFPSGTSTTNSTTYSTLMGEGIDVVWAPTNTGFSNYTHEKTVIIDPGTANAQAWIMTMNLDASAPKYNREYVALDTLAADVAEAESIFQADYAATSITPTGSLVVAPSSQGNAQPTLLSLINSAQTSIDIEAEEYDASGLESAIASALESKAKGGVMVRMVLEDSTNSSQASAVAALQAAGGQVVGYAYGSASLDIHAKAIVVDGKTAFIGSENLSGGSLGYNRELGVVFSVASEVQKVASTIDSDFKGGSAYSSQ